MSPEELDKGQRQWVRDNAKKLQAEWNAMPDVPRTIEQHLNAPLAAGITRDEANSLDLTEYDMRVINAQFDDIEGVTQ